MSGLVRRTVSDWLTHAGAATDAAEVERCLAGAEAEARGCHDWRTLLRGVAELPLAPRERVAHVAARTLELAAAEREVWGFRDVATVRATRLEDEAGARAALEAGADAFREPRTDLLGRPALARGYEWVLLGKGFVETLRDPDGMRRCLEAGRAQARALRRAEDLADLATAWASHVDRAAGVALLLEAERMEDADAGAARPWTLANAWHSLGEPEAVHRVLDAALQASTSSDAALHVAKAWASHHDLEQARRALGRAEALAATATAWLNVGEAALDAGLGEAVVRRALGRAEALATDADARARVSGAYRDWLRDQDAATRLGPRGVRPDALRRRVRSLPEWDTSAAGLFDWLRARATPEGLANIAAADYGMDADKHLAALRDLCETGLVPRALVWEPHEVLALTRWSSGESVQHLERALCCVLLCLAPQEMDELVTNGPILAESCLALGADATHLAEQFFAWRSETEAAAEQDEEGGPEQPIALLLLFLLRAASAPDDPRLATLAEVLTEHPRYPLAMVAGWMAESMRAELWTDLADRILVPAAKDHPPAARVLRALGR